MYIHEAHCISMLRADAEDDMYGVAAYGARAGTSSGGARSEAAGAARPVVPVDAAAVVASAACISQVNEMCQKLGWQVAYTTAADGAGHCPVITVTACIEVSCLLYLPCMLMSQ
jgi:hypothetical protein